MKPPVIVDIETVGDPHTGRVVTLGWQELGEEQAHVATFEQVPQAVFDMMADPDRPFVSHTKYDARFLKLSGVEVTGPYYDTQVMAWLLNENQSLALDALVLRYCKYRMDKRIRTRAGEVLFQCDDGTLVPVNEAPLEQLYAYNVRDVEAETELFQTLWERIEDIGWLDYWLTEEVPFTEVLLGMEVAGLPIDLDRTEAFAFELERRHIDMAEDLLAVVAPQGSVPFLLSSNDHVAAYLYHPGFIINDALRYSPDTIACIKSCFEGEHEDCEAPGDWDITQHMVDLLPEGFVLDSIGRDLVHGHWKLKGRGLKPVERTPSGDKWSVSKNTLKGNYHLAVDPWVQDLLLYRQVDKLLTTYLRKFPTIAHDGRIFGRFNQTGTKTGRLSSSGPNLQNIPSHGDLGPRTRDLFRGNLVVGDYSQLEPRIMAHYSQDPRLLAVYQDGAGDVYTDMAEMVFGESSKERRTICKTLVLAMGYGAGDKKVGSILTVNGYPTDMQTGQSYVAELRRAYPTFFEWREQVIAMVKQTGFVQTIGGRKRRLKAAFVDRRNWKNVGYGERQAVNAIIQGSAGDIVRRVMVQQARLFEHSLRLLAQVHDELVWERTGTWFGSDDALLVDLKAMAEQLHGYQLSVPLVFEPHFGESWYSAKEGAELDFPEDLNEETLDHEEEH